MSDRKENFERALSILKSEERDPFVVALERMFQQALDTVVALGDAECECTQCVAAADLAAAFIEDGMWGDEAEE